MRGHVFNTYVKRALAFARGWQLDEDELKSRPCDLCSRMAGFYFPGD